MDRRGSMETPGEKSPVARAMSQFLQALQEGEGVALKGKQAPLVKVEVEAGEHNKPGACEACEAGTCDNPEHMGAEDMAGLSAMYSE